VRVRLRIGLRARVACLVALGCLAASGPGIVPTESRARPAKDRSCATRSSREAAFTGPEAHDVVRFELRGEPCAKAVFSVSVARADGRLLYSFERPLSDFYPSGDPLEAQLADDLIEFTPPFADPQGAFTLSSTRALPAYRAGAFELDDMASARIVVDPVRYERLRAANRPTLDHAIGHEMGRVVVFDPEGDAAIAVLEWWM